MANEIAAEVTASPHGSPERPFVEVHPRTPDIDDALAQLVGRLWKIHLARLYMYTGRFMPQEAKELGCYFGFCDEKGVRVKEVDVRPEESGLPRFKVTSSATHVGWTVAK